MLVAVVAAAVIGRGAIVVMIAASLCGGTIYDGEGTVGRDHIIGRNSNCHAFGPAAARWLLILLIW